MVANGAASWTSKRRAHLQLLRYYFSAKTFKRKQARISCRIYFNIISYTVTGKTKSNVAKE